MRSLHDVVVQNERLGMCSVEVIYVIQPIALSSFRVHPSSLLFKDAALNGNELVNAESGQVK